MLKCNFEVANGFRVVLGIEVADGAMQVVLSQMVRFEMGFLEITLRVSDGFA